MVITKYKHVIIRSVVNNNTCTSNVHQFNYFEIFLIGKLIENMEVLQTIYSNYVIATV
jgi:hypothetical protein